jgi:hypothetical protein
MGFVLSILYFVTYYLTPHALFGPLAAFRIELILSVLIFGLSIPALTKSSILKTPQSLALICLAMTSAMSVLIGVHWLGGALSAILSFSAVLFTYFVICLHINSWKRLQVLVLMLLFVCLFVIVHGSIDLLHRIPPSAHNLPDDMYRANLEIWGVEHPYIMPAGNDLPVGGEQEEQFYRLRGQGEINDPNDFGQLLVCVIPLVFIFWRPKSSLRNFMFVILPVCALLFGAYLTHSRGTLLALVAIALIAARRRIGTIPALLLAVGIFVGAMALNFTGGRGISASAGVDRTELWSEGLQILKSHPLFGVGAGKMPDFTDSHHTAHNSVVVCAAELGMFGLFFWCLFLFPTLRDVLAVASPEKVSESNQPMPEDGPLHLAATKFEAIDKTEINRLGQLLLLSLTGFLVAGWFLSRAFAVTLFLLGGMVEVVYEMALQRGMIAPRLRLVRMLPYAGGFAISLVLVMYIALRVLNLVH